MQNKWKICMIALGLLVIYNIISMSKMMFVSECPKQVYTKNMHHRDIPPVPPPLTLPCDTQLATLTTRLNLKLGRWDNRKLYKIFDNVFVGEKHEELTSVYTVCLATQSSLERLVSLVQVAAHWSGPVSVAAFVVGDELSPVLTYIGYLRRCFPFVRDRVNFHLIFPRHDQPASVSITPDDHARMDCRNPRGLLHTLIKDRLTAINQWKRKNPYPQNHLRNVARKNCHTDHVFLTDIDIIPGINMAEGLNEFLQDNAWRKGKFAYVIPTYELDTRVQFPHNKTELVRLSRKGLARPFHEKVFIYNQYATNLSRWQNITKESSKVHISYAVTNFEFFYEPFYVASDEVPAHDERFIGYGFTRNTQTYETFLAGYKFYVLSPIFACHWGLQTRKGRPFWRETQNALNQKLFDTFKKEVAIRYNRDPFNMAKTVRKV